MRWISKAVSLLICLLFVLLLTSESHFDRVCASGSPVILSSSVSDPAHYYQHHVWRAKGRWWVFYSDGAARYSSSSDGVTDWGGDILHSGVDLNQRVDSYFNGTHFFLVLGYVPPDPDRYAWFRMGEPHEDGSITWLAGWQNVGKAGSHCTEVSIAADNQGYPWILRNDDSEHRLNVLTSTTRDGTWSTKPGFPYELDHDTDTEGCIIPVGESSVYVVWSPTNGWDSSPTPLLGRLWNGTTSSWDGEETVTTGPVMYNFKFCGLSTQNELMLAFTDISNAHAKVRKKIIGQGWEEELDVSESLVVNTPCLMKANEKPMVLWCDSSNGIWARLCDEGEWKPMRCVANEEVGFEGGWADVEQITAEHFEVGLLFWAGSTLYFDTISVFPNGRITVPDDYLTIQEAVNAASDGDSIFVRNGAYYEHVVVNKSVSLFGENRETTIIDGSMTGNVVQVTRDYVNVSGFTIQRSGQAFSNSGIHVGSTRQCDISANCIVDNEFGVFGSPRNMSITDNIIERNFLGIALDVGATSNFISRNYLVANYVSVHLNFADANYIFQNTMTDNYRSVTLWSSKDNRLYHNNFLNNTFGSVNDANFLDNGIEGNYWSDYTGTDADGDGIGDIPYVIDEYNQDNYPLMNLYWNPADIDHDLRVSIFDVVKCAVAYGSTPLDPNWNPHADIARPYGVIDIFDLVMIASSYGEEYAP